MKQTLTALALVGLIGTSGQAVALPAASAKIDWSSLTYTLSNLGYSGTPSVSFVAGTEFTGVHAFVNVPIYQDINDWTTPISASGTPGLFSATADSFKLIADANLPIYDSVYGHAEVIRGAYFTLSPMTLAVFSVYAEVAAPAPASSAISSATVNMFVSRREPNGGAQRTDGFLQTSNSSSSDAGTLSVSFLNMTDFPMTGYMAVYGGAFAMGTMMPIPEPETYGLMLAGLGLLGWVVRRRRA